MKHTPARIFMTLLAFGLAFTHISCSSNLSELTGSVSLEIPQSIVSRASLEGENEGSSELYVVAMVKGDDYAAAQYKTIRAGSLSSDDRFMKLLDIPTDKNIRIDMAVIDNQGVRKYYGSTGTFYVQHGINVQNIRLTRINENNNMGAASDYDHTIAMPEYNGLYVGYGLQSFATISLYPDGWYKLIADTRIISEGIWESLTDSIVHITEYIYHEINPIQVHDVSGDYYVPYPNSIIAEKPMEYDIHLTSNSETPDLELRNGVIINY